MGELKGAGSGVGVFTEPARATAHSHFLTHAP